MDVSIHLGILLMTCVCHTRTSLLAKQVLEHLHNAQNVVRLDNWAGRRGCHHHAAFNHESTHMSSWRSGAERGTHAMCGSCAKPLAEHDWLDVYGVSRHGTICCSPKKVDGHLLIILCHVPPKFPPFLVSFSGLLLPRVQSFCS